MKSLAWALVLPIVTEAANYSAKKGTADGIEIVRLADSAHATEVSIVPSFGNIAYAMTVHGKNILWSPFKSLAEMKAQPALCGVPFLEPWANRLDQDAFYANGRKYLLNADLGNVRRDQNQKPIHGLLLFSPYWKVTKLEAGDGAARVTSRLEFWRYPELMAQFPFAHAVEMTYKLAGGTLEVETLLENQASDPMPVGVGYHPYFQVPDMPRDQCKVHVAARDHLELSPELIPTGERTSVTYPDPVSLATTQLDDVFSHLVRGKDERAEFWVQGGGKKISVVYGPKYTVAVIYAPPGKDFICFEPMSAITDAFNLAHRGIYKELQSIPPGGTWRESFWIVPSGF
ncbi:MAG TPA: aldose 1-epimerase [Bryobacteraceae bacterium]|jgi:aldose 1-epimerase|nr:aldose 1-epimerase [Bryobacteraceae bacterium]